MTKSYVLKSYVLNLNVDVTKHFLKILELGCCMYNAFKDDLMASNYYNCCCNLKIVLCLCVLFCFYEANFIVPLL